MRNKETIFGTLPNGKSVYEYTLENTNGMQVKTINYGGIITSILVPDKNGIPGDVILGFDSLDEYVKDTSYIGAIIGRFANRIAKGKFSLDGNDCSLAINNGENSLHGGVNGFHKAFWDIVPFDSEKGEAVELSYFSRDGEEGFPGNLKVKVTYTLTPDNKLIIDYYATTDKKTIINLTQHSYFNLSAGSKKDILSHDLQIFAQHYLPTNKSQIPTGILEKVYGTPMDFSKLKPIGRDIDQNNKQLKIGAGYDHTWVIDENLQGLLNHAAQLVENESGRCLDIFTSEPGIQFYSGNYLDVRGKGKNGMSYGHRSGMGLETQHFPDSPNKPNFPKVILEAGQEFNSKTEFRFSTI